MSVREPRYLVPFAALFAVTFIPRLVARYRLRQLMIAGEVDRILETWYPAISRTSAADTLAPLMAATAYAAYGRVDSARASMNRASYSAGWENALEQRLFVEALLDSFEGDRTSANEKAEQLEKLEIRGVGFFARRRIVQMRRGMTALTRAFSHRSLATDAALLERAGESSPLIHWAMRYASAIVAIDRGEPSRVRTLLASAPSWPVNSAFFDYHRELLGKAG